MSTGTNKERLEQNNILLEDIKTQIQNLPEAGGSGDVKLFETEEEMQADTTAKEGDLAVVYRNEIQNIKDGDVITSMTFPKTVVFDTAITTDYSSMLRNSTEPRIYLDIQLSSTSFMITDMYGTIPEITYTSSDGITYTRTDTNADTYEIGETTISGVDEHICKFMQVGGMYFDGLFEYQKYSDANNYKIIKNINIIQNTSYEATYDATEEEFDNESLKSLKDLLLNEISTNTSYTLNSYLLEKINNDTYKAYLDVYSNTFYACGIIRDLQVGSNYIGAYLGTNGSQRPIYIYEINLSLKTIQLVNTINSFTTIADMNNNKCEYIENELITSERQFVLINNIDIAISNDSKKVVESIVLELSHPIKFKYFIASNQLTATSESIYNAIAYGKDGIVEGTLVKNISNSFADTNAEIVYKIQNAYNNMEPRVLTDGDKTIDKNIYFIPVKKDGTVLLDTSNVTTMARMFNSCTNLTTIPLLDTSSVTDMTYMFQNCTNLTEIPLLNTSSVTNMGYMFTGCTNLTTIPLLDTGNVTIMHYMFSNCTNLTTIPLLNTGSVTSMQYMFQNCTSLTEIPLLDTSNVTSMQYMFYSCKNLITIPLLDTSSVINIAYMFSGCTNLTTIPLLDTSSVTNMSYMFNGCTNLTTIPLLDTSKVTNMARMFNGCTSLSDASLNNILAMCTNAVKITSSSYKTLKYIGLTEEQATKCTTLSNYSAFTAAGWTTGY